MISIFFSQNSSHPRLDGWFERWLCFCFRSSSSSSCSSSKSSIFHGFGVGTLTNDFLLRTILAVVVLVAAADAAIFLVLVLVAQCFTILWLLSA